MALLTSNLSRFQPKYAAQASGTPLRRYQRQLAHAATIVTVQRRLPLTQAKSQAIRVAKKGRS
jgi:hypothetical protein